MEERMNKRFIINLTKVLVVIAFIVGFAFYFGRPKETSSGADTIVRLQAYDLLGYYLTNSDSEMKVDKDISPIYDSYYVQRKGLANSKYVSLESVSHPGHFLKNDNNILTLSENDGSADFKENATFKKVSGLASSAYTSFQAYKDSNLYMKIKDGKCIFEEISGASDKKDATFKLYSTTSTMTNPRDTDRDKADPYVYSHTDGYYYGMHTYTVDGAYTPKLIMYKSRNLSDLFNTEGKIIWTAPDFGWNTENIWAPELHYIDKVWYIYYSGGGKTGVLKNTNADPTTGTWTDAGRLYVEDADDWAIDGTILMQNGSLYFLWSGITPSDPGVQKIFISKMSSPTSLTGKRVELSRPSFSWEQQGTNGVYNVNEGPSVLQHNGKTFVTYSASFCSTQYYCLGMLTCDSKADPLVPSNWTKSQKPVFQASEENGLWGVGHNSFVKSKNDDSDWIIYHAMMSPNNYAPRMVSMQRFTWNSDGTPNFGTPVGRYNTIPKPNGE
ncbi:hypothetical protein C1I91_26315 [Clostridium manihotivorum]|uniref:Alpha-L-arabinofuranosidase B arabinose-binding domain-containing protein n=2 Tax=Clostridium manihotivorum TaxID=2320868 RepID=A0A410E0K2_9CLOT|nr:hypothetical protein C1I91_26315 [Clostridium manihotivorum]